MTGTSNSKGFWAIIRIKEEYCNWSKLEDWEKMVALTVTKVIHATQADAVAEADRLNAIPHPGPKDEHYAAFHAKMRRLRERSAVARNPDITYFEADTLEQEINSAVAQHPGLQITLDHDADVLNLALNVDVRVQSPGSQTYRTFSILSAAGAKGMVYGEANDLKPWYCTGGPLCIVREITGQSIADSVVAYLQREQK